MKCNNCICRICLQDGAIYPIFENVQEVLSKLSLCLQVTIEDIDGYPRHICKTCKDTLDILYNFINKFKESYKILEKGLYDLKQESESCDNYEHSDQSEVEFKTIDVKDEPIVILPPDEDHNKTTFNIQQSKIITKRGQVEKVKIKNKTAAHQKRQLSRIKTNRISSSILEGEFTWTGEEWCLKTNKINNPTKETVKYLQKLIKLKVPKVKKPPPPKLCDLCGGVFKNQDKLSIHKRIVHFKIPVKCPNCPRICASDYYLKCHIKRKHENEKHFICASCGKGFAFKGELASHYRNVHDKVLKPKKIFSCKICNKTYKCAKSVIIHERSVHTGDRPAVCAVCGTSFFHDEYLREHMRLHTGETPFKCPICGRGYAQRCNMKSHLRIHRVSELDAATLSKLKPNYIKLLKA